MKTQLFLLGGSAAYEVYADDFVEAAGGCSATIAVLAQTRAGWEKHRVEITQPWLDRGVSCFTPIVPDDEIGVVDHKSALMVLSNATGVFISGGHTPTYHQLYVTDPIGAILRERHQDGIPIAGVSAGALISSEICQLTHDEAGAGDLRVVQGLCLVSGFVIGVHFSERNALADILTVMSKTRTEVGFGIDDSACVVCENGEFARVLGESVYRIEMSDFDEPSYQMVPL